MFHKTINNNELNEFLKNKNKFISDKELKNMKIQELRELSNKNNINSIQKKLDLIQELSLIYKEFN
jgi:transcription initiation factor TFIIIB Brf1 subunit/transcription initiation factor TFIIB